MRFVQVLPPPPPSAGTRLYYAHNDHLGTPQVFTDQNQNVVWQADYQPFGEVSESVNIFANNLRFAGQYFDEESGLHYNYFRDYDPGTGRYVQSDPIGLGGGLNTYGYVRGNPLRFIDPFGLFPGCRLVAGDPGFDDYYICDDGGPKYNNGDASAFSSATNNACVKECIDEEILSCAIIPSSGTSKDLRVAAAQAVACVIVTVTKCSKQKYCGE